MTSRAMPTRRLPLILALASLPVLAACHGGEAAEPPVSPEALAAVKSGTSLPREALAREIDALFTDETAGETRALVALRGGRIVAERYGAGYGPQSRLVGWSMSKTITGVLIGLLVADGRLRLDEGVPIPLWQRSGDPRGEITLRQLLQMRSGLRHVENGKPVWQSDEVRMMFLDGRDDMAAYAEAQPLQDEPGKVFRYSSATSVILADIAARALTDSRDPTVRRQAVQDYLRTRLFEPLGMHSAVPEFDAAGTLAGSGMIHATARDWARLGEFLRNGGAVKGAQVVPRGWIEFMTRPSPANPAYGAQLWLNRQPRSGPDMLMAGRAPQSLFAAIGHLGQYAIVSPPQDLVLVRLGKSDHDQRAAVVDHLAKIVAVFPRQ